MRTRRRALGFWLCIGLSILAGAAGAFWMRQSLHPLLPETVLELPLGNLSGLVYHVRAGHLVGVSDEGWVVGISDSGDIVHRMHFAGLDLEDVALAPDGSSLWLLDERGSQVVEISWPAGAIGRSIPLMPLGRPSPNRGFEGLATLSGERFTTFVVSEDHPAAFAQFDQTTGFGKPIVLSGVPSLSAILTVAGDDRVVLVSRERGLAVASEEGELLSPWRRVEFENLESATFHPGLGLVLGTDRGQSRLTIFRNLKSIDDVLRACLDS